jgi:hypothetical protein
LNSPPVLPVSVRLGNRPSRRPFDNGWGATGSPKGSALRLTNAQYADMGRRRADLDVKLLQLRLVHWIELTSRE